MFHDGESQSTMVRLLKSWLNCSILATFDENLLAPELGWREVRLLPDKSHSSLSPTDCLWATSPQQLGRSLRPPPTFSSNELFLMPRFKSINLLSCAPGPSDPSQGPSYDFLSASVLLPPLDYGIPEGTDLVQCWASLFSPHAVLSTSQMSTLR